MSTDVTEEHIALLCFFDPEDGGEMILKNLG
jgi:hypothetical protein